MRRIGHGCGKEAIIERSQFGAAWFEFSYRYVGDLNTADTAAMSLAEAALGAALLLQGYCSHRT